MRSIALLIPDWPVVAVRRSASGPRTTAAALAILDHGRVVACSPEAALAGVEPGLRKREAQSRCPALEIVAADPDRDAKAYEPIVERLEAVVSGVQVVRPGLCRIRARGPERYFAGERPAALALLAAIRELGIEHASAGVADGPFTAQIAARIGDPVRVVPVGASAGFLAPIPIAALGDERLAELLPRLGVRTLGDFAALDVASVRERFGDRGVRLHALASGADSRPVLPRTPPPELSRQVAFDAPLVLADQVAFAIRATADAFIAGLTSALLVCTELRVELVDEDGHRSERVWLHPSAFDAAAVVDRVRWQLDAAEGLTSGVAEVRLDPVAVDGIGHHEPGLFGAGADERVHHALSRVQAMLGHDGVVTPVIGGGRWLAERQVLVPWGERPAPPQPRERPWPGSLPEPLPATVYPEPLPVTLLDGAERPVGVTPRGAITAPPVALLAHGRRTRVIGWAGPWPIEERAWDRDRHRSASRFQIVDADHAAWLLVLERGEWWAEGRYD